METEIRNAIITKAQLTTGDRGFLDCWLTLDYGGSGQGFGGYCLYLPKGFRNHEIKSHAGHHIFRVMEIAGVTEWDRIAGKSIRAMIEKGLIKGIGHIVKDDWFIPSDDFKAKDGEE